MAYQPTMVSLLSDSKEFQLLMDNVAETFEPPIWNKYLTEVFSLSLDWRAVLAVMQNSPAASVIDFSSGKPIATRPGVSKLSGELASFGNKYQMTKKDLRDLLELQDNVGRMGIDPSKLIDFIIPDIKRATIGPHKTIDRLFLEAISTGVMSLTSANNPKGVVWKTALDWGIVKKYCAVTWATSATATPITEIRKVVDDRLAEGIPTGKIKMSRVTFNNMVATTQFKEAFKLQIGNIKDINNVFLGLGNVNSAMMAMDLPEIEIIDYPIQVEGKDGNFTAIKPFADHRVSFSADDNYGELKYTYANEQRLPVAGKTYATAMNVLISKYRDNDGNEFTESEFNAFPVLNAAKHLNILVTDATQA